MILQYASDLHLEFPENKKFIESNPLRPASDILILAGDIIPFDRMSIANDFLKYVSDNFQFTYWIPGNHEYYHSDIAERSGSFSEKIMENVFLINNKTVNHGDIRIVFSTLWSNISPAHEWEISRQVNDFYVIKFNGYSLSVAAYNYFHSSGLSFIEKEISQPHTGKTIVITHHVPTYFHYPEKYKSSTINEAFATELFPLIEKAAIDYWIYGHHHWNLPDFSIGKTKLVTNQLGYVKSGEQRLFSPDQTILL